MNRRLSRKDAMRCCPVGSTDLVPSEIEAYKNIGIRVFVFSGYLHLE